MLYGWESELREVADNSAVLSHAFLRELPVMASSDRRSAIKRWMVQDYFVSRYFPRLLGLLIAQIEDPEVRHPLVVNLWEEHGEGLLGKTHFQLFVDLMASVGVSVPSADDLSASTASYLAAQEDICQRDLFAGLGVFCYANEYIILEEFRPLWQAVADEYPNADVSFFRANVAVDARHAKETEQVIGLLAGGPGDIVSVRKGAEAALAARNSFYDGLVAASASR